MSYLRSGMVQRKSIGASESGTAGQDERLAELRRQAQGIECAQDRSNVLRVLDELERIRANHNETQRNLAAARRRTLRWAVVLGLLAFTWLTLMLVYHL